MKSLSFGTALLVGAILVTGSVGCKKTPGTVTMIPGSKPTPIDNGDKVAGPVTLPGNKVTGAGTGPGDGASTAVPLTGPGTGTGTTSTPIDPLKAAQPGDRPDPNITNEDPTTLKAETVYFALDRATVTPAELPKIERVATFLKNETTASLRVEGNCDERGTEDYNRSLGERRALAIRELLVNSGVAPDRVTTVTYGEDKPADTGHDEGAWSKNRRGDFVVLRPKTLQ